jgi:hypothetical protein
MVLTVTDVALGGLGGTAHVSLLGAVWWLSVVSSGWPSITSGLRRDEVNSSEVIDSCRLSSSGGYLLNRIDMSTKGSLSLIKMSEG